MLIFLRFDRSFPSFDDGKVSWVFQVTDLHKPLSAPGLYLCERR